MHSTAPRPPGRLLSVEGISGVGKTHLATAVLSRHPPASRPVLLEEFSRRPHTQHAHDLGRDLLRALVAAADGDPFLRSGHPRTETLLLLAIKTHDYETSRPALLAGTHIIEGRSLDTIAVYQSLITQPDDHDAYQSACDWLTHATRWRPLPDHTILITDDVPAAVSRAQTRDRTTFTTEQWHLHHRAAALFEQLAATFPERIQVLDLRDHHTDAAEALSRALVRVLPPLDQPVPVTAPSSPPGTRARWS